MAAAAPVDPPKLYPTAVTNGPPALKPLRVAPEISFPDIVLDYLHGSPYEKPSVYANHFLWIFRRASSDHVANVFWITFHTERIKDLKAKIELINRFFRDLGLTQDLSYERFSYIANIRYQVEYDKKIYYFALAHLENGTGITDKRGIQKLKWEIPRVRTSTLLPDQQGKVDALKYIIPSWKIPVFPLAFPVCQVILLPDALSESSPTTFLVKPGHMNDPDDEKG